MTILPETGLQGRPGLPSFCLVRLATQHQIRQDYLYRSATEQLRNDHPNSPGVRHSVASNKLRQEASHTGAASHGMEISTRKVCYSQCCAQHASSSSCRRLQEANLQSRKTLLDCCRTSGKNRRTDQCDHMQTDRTGLTETEEHPLRSAGPPRQARLG